MNKRIAPPNEGYSLYQCFYSISILLICNITYASDYSREIRILEEVEESVLVGEPIRLKAGEFEFLAIHTEAETAKTKGAVILLHGRGAHPNWVDTIQPLRSELPGSGWETLSLQMPVASAEAPDWIWHDLIPEAFPRIKAGIEFLKQRKRRNIALLGHSFGARMGAEFLATEKPNEINYFIAVGLPADRKQVESGTLGALKKLRIPLLDIYGSQDISPVLESVKSRAAAALKAKNRNYRQIEITGADHFFTGLDAVLVAQIRSWLERGAGYNR